MQSYGGGDVTGARVVVIFVVVDGVVVKVFVVVVDIAVDGGEVARVVTVVVKPTVAVVSTLVVGRRVVCGVDLVAIVVVAGVVDFVVGLVVVVVVLVTHVPSQHALMSVLKCQPGQHFCQRFNTRPAHQ